MKDSKKTIFRAYVYGIDADGKEVKCPACSVDAPWWCNQYEFDSIVKAQAAIVELIVNFRKHPKHFGFVKVIGSSVVRVVEEEFVTAAPTPITPNADADNRPFPIAAFSV